MNAVRRRGAAEQLLPTLHYNSHLFNGGAIDEEDSRETH